MWQDFPGHLVVKTPASPAGAWVPSLVRELKFHMPCNEAKKKKKKGKTQMEKQAETEIQLKLEKRNYH